MVKGYKVFKRCFAAVLRWLRTRDTSGLPKTGEKLGFELLRAGIATLTVQLFVGNGTMLLAGFALLFVGGVFTFGSLPKDGGKS